jgi:hypothetical protein
MSYSFEYRPEIPHGIAWSQGYSSGDTCSIYPLQNTKDRSKGVLITIRHIPWKGNDQTFLRFWAARGGQTHWEDFQEAYDEKGPMEEEPAPDYPNGGMVKVSKKGKVKFRVHLPKGYMSEEGFIPPHFHFLLCNRGKRTPVHTVFMRRQSTKCPSSLLVHTDPRSLDVNLRAIFNRQYNMYRDLEATDDPNTYNSQDQDKHKHHHHHHHHHNKKTNTTHDIHDPHETPMYLHNRPCSTFWDTNCDHYEVLPGPVSGAIMGGQHYVQPFKMRERGLRQGVAPPYGAVE